MRNRILTACGLCVVMLSARPVMAQIAANPTAHSTGTATTAATDNGDPEPTVISIPVGGSVTAPSSTTSQTGGSGTLGLQVAKQDQFFGAIFFSFGAAQTVSGEQSVFGAALLDPSTQGKSFYATGNRVVRELPGAGGLISISGRVGATWTTWQTTANNSTQSIDGALFFLAAGGQWSTHTHTWGNAGDPAHTNHYKIALDGSLAVRSMVNALGQSNASAFRTTAIGVADTSFVGFEGTFILTLNDVQPFVRFSHFGAANPIDGFTGNQIVLGVNAVTPIFQSK